MTESIKLPNGYTENIDEDGFPTRIPNYIEGIPASFKSTTRADETLANQSGYTADVVIEIMDCNYNGADILIDESTGEEYEVKRTHKVRGKDTMELTCQKR